ncbi:carboxylating nicotinate-nucleotide diphosphorylase [Rubinisphaera italica]|uniref:Probable nicotinate-nucleotide pyrophosphorylase [carboxylating] n=1 Tax=Rubinisphaera italica TaxID=2527969 RepID=A0A5C5XIG3_9PLAN|nr:carboxylating nicotinate-nucleotide diphosphorylase [Rubinisphaera italica]TWT62790.1 Nicotinate-nucleotide pyrophosphorylase [carboxylating] [Rubinisphaera italica]
MPQQTNHPSWEAAEQQAAERLIVIALEEDFGQRGDVTSLMFIDPARTGRVRIATRKPGRIAGVPIIPLVLQQIDPTIKYKLDGADGDELQSGQSIAVLEGAVQKILMAERTILNFMTHLSGVATLTSSYVAKAQGTKAQILDTRKTLPGYRLLEKYAVRCGGGCNHRMGLYDAVMLKDNHLASMTHKAPAELISSVREKFADISIIIEIDQLDQMPSVLSWKPDVILLDNMSNEDMTKALKIRDQHNKDVLLEASGGINLQTVAAIANTGVDRISVGELTHSAPALDLGFDWIER